MREYYSDVKIATLSQWGFTMSLKKNLEKIATSVSNITCQLQSRRTLWEIEEESIRPSFIFKKITHAFYSKEPVDKSEKRISKRNYCVQTCHHMTHNRATGNKVHCFEVPLEERRCSVKCAFDLYSGDCQRNTYPFPPPHKYPANRKKHPFV